MSARDLPVPPGYRPPPTLARPGAAPPPAATLPWPPARRPRPRPLAQLAALMAEPAARAVWIAAPPGSGKSSLGAEWAAAGAAPPCRVALDAAAIDPGDVWQRLFAAAGVAPPARLAAVEAWVQPERAGTLAARAFWQGLPAEARLVLDDCDPAGEGTGPVLAATVIAPLLAQAGPSQRVLLLARQPPPVQLLAERAAGRLHELPGEALRLDADERTAWQAAPGADGWPLAAAWLARAGDPAAREAELVGWIAGVLLPALPAPQQRLLERAAWWPEIEPAHLAAAEQDAFLALRAGGVLVQCQGERLRVHALLQRALQDRARARQPAEALVHALCDAAEAAAPQRPPVPAPTPPASEAPRADDLALALWRHALGEATGASPAAARAARARCASWLLARAPQFLAAGRHRAWMAALAGIPPEERSAALWLALAQAHAPFDPLQAREAADRATVLATARTQGPGGDDARVALSAQVLAIATQFQAFDDTRPLAARLAQLQAHEPALAVPDAGAPESDLPVHLAGAAVAVYSALFLRCPADPRLPRWRGRVRRLLDERGVDANLRVRAAMLLAKDHWYRGQHGTLAVLPLLAGTCNPTGLAALAPYSRLLGGLQAQYGAWARADWADGLAHTHAALAEAEASGIPLLDRHLRLHGACFAHLAGEGELATRWMTEVAATADTTRRMEAWHHLCVRAWLALAAGEAASAAETAQAAGEAASAMGPAPLAMALAVQAHALLDLGHTGPRLDAVHAALARAGTPDNALAGFHGHVLGARQAEAQGEPELALQAWTAALEVARAHDLWAPFGASPAALAAGLARVITDGAMVEPARRMARALRLPAPAGADARWPWPLVVELAEEPGNLRLLKNGEPMVLAGKPPRRLLALLQNLAEAPRPLPVPTLIDRLWPELEGDRAAAAFETALLRLRVLLGLPRALVRSQGTLGLDRRQVWVEPATRRRADAQAPAARPLS